MSLLIIVIIIKVAMLLLYDFNGGVAIVRSVLMMLIPICLRVTVLLFYIASGLSIFHLMSNVNRRTLF